MQPAWRFEKTEFQTAQESHPADLYTLHSKLVLVFFFSSLLQEYSFAKYNKM